jgi:Na+/melibiose symporter-like transporter
MEKNSNASFSKIFLIGLGFMTTQVLWVHFNGFVPIILESALLKEFGINFALFGIFGTATIIGFIMTWDNIIAFFLQPYIGNRSDSTRTKFGRRMPYIIVGIPSAAIMFILIPILGAITIWLIIPVILLFNFSMAIYRSPAVSLMPDMVPSEKRSLANGIINLMGGLGSAIMIFVGAYIYKNVDKTVSFAFGSLLIIILGLILFLTVKEPQEYTEFTKSNEPGILHQFNSLVHSKDKSPIFMLFAILCWFIAWNAIEAFFTLYGKNVLLVDESVAQGTLFYFAIFFVVSTLPAGLIGQYLGRITTMRIGILFFIVLILTASTATSIDTLKFILMGCGVAWALVNVNSIVVIWEHAKDNGSGTGLYYAFSSLAAITGPVLAGFLSDSFHTLEILFPFSAILLIIAFLFLMLVKKGEANEVIDKSFYLESADNF